MSYSSNSSSLRDSKGKKGRKSCITLRYNCHCFMKKGMQCSEDTSWLTLGFV